MRLIGARQAWHDAYHENRDSVMSVAAEMARLGRKQGEDKKRVVVMLEDENGVEVARSYDVRGSVDPHETRASGVRLSSGRCAHMFAAGLVMHAVESLPKPIQHFGHFMYSPLATGNDLGIAHSLVWFGSGLDDSTPARKKHQAYWMALCALRSYKCVVSGRQEMSRVEVCSFVEDRIGRRMHADNWSRDWSDIWEGLQSRIGKIDMQALKPIAELIERKRERDEAVNAAIGW